MQEEEQQSEDCIGDIPIEELNQMELKIDRLVRVSEKETEMDEGIRREYYAD